MGKKCHKKILRGELTKGDHWWFDGPYPFNEKNPAPVEKIKNNFLCIHCYMTKLSIGQQIKCKVFDFNPCWELDLDMIVCKFAIISPRKKKLQEICENQPYCRQGQNFSSEEGQNFRKGKITSSDILPGLMAIPNAFLSWKAAYEKLKKEIPDKKPNEFTQKILDYGHEMEPLILRMFCKKRKLKASDIIEEVGTWHKDDLIYASPDGLWWNEEMKRWQLIEIKSKCPFVPNSYCKVPQKHEIKPSYLLQIWAQMYCTGIRDASLVYFAEDPNNGPTMVWYYLWWDDETFDAITKNVTNCLDRILKLNPDDVKIKPRWVNQFSVTDFLFQGINSESGPINVSKMFEEIKKRET